MMGGPGTAGFFRSPRCTVSAGATPLGLIRTALTATVLWERPMRRSGGRRTRTDPYVPPFLETLERFAVKICERMSLPRESVRWVDYQWQYLRNGRWIEVPWYIYCVDPAREG
jgi:hypothetical protein